MYKVSLFVPSHNKRDEHLGLELISDALNYVTRKFCELYGGCTTQNGNGQWFDDNGVRHAERVIIVWAYTDNSQESELSRLAYYLRVKLYQESVLYSVENVESVVFVTGDYPF